MEKRTVKQNGGKRKGAGRKKANHTIASEKAREFLINSIVEQLAPIVSAQIDAAKGLFYIGKEGKIYTKLPDTKVGEYLLNQVAGKAKESVQIQNDDERPWIINLAK
ncbi:MAG TPA: hypothetical protein HA284_03165 [Nanoarchaeota archaeon]|nr:MAG: hypothetical protein UU28_C0036G0003 [Parcubacteria group bacterium GW2011_GWD2_40_9]HIH52510.1 hypothetical protein [Nanoarchaeota archaeon]